MRERRRADGDGYLLDDVSDDASSTSSEPGDCNWLVLAGTFIIQLVISGVLASYGVLLLSLVEETGVSVREALWTPVVYAASWSLADPMCKKVSDKKEGHGSRLLAVIGIVTAAGGLASTPLLRSSGLQIIGYGLLGGLGTSLVLTQADVMLNIYYPRYSRGAAATLCIPQLGSALAHFTMPLILLGFVSLYGSHEVPLIQAGLVVQSLIGALSFIPPARRSAVSPRYSYRPRAYTFVDNESPSIVRRENHVNNSYNGSNLLSYSSSSRGWKNPSSTEESIESTNSTSKPPPVYDLSPRCYRNQFKINILPEIPEESEDDCESDVLASVDIHNDASDTHPSSHSLTFPPNSTAKSLELYLDEDKVNSKITKQSVENKRWSIGTLEEMLPICVENGLSQGRPLLTRDSCNTTENTAKEFKNWDQIQQKSNSHIDNAFSLNGELWTTKSSGVVNTLTNTRDINEFDPVLSSSTEMPNVGYSENAPSSCRKVKSLNDVIPVLKQDDVDTFNDNLKISVASTNISYVGQNIHESLKYDGTVQGNIKECKCSKSTEESENNKQWYSLGNFEDLISANDRVDTEIDSYRKWHSAEFEKSDKFTDLSHVLSHSGVHTFEMQETQNSNEAEVSETVLTCQESDDPTTTSQESEDSEKPQWSAKVVSLESGDISLENYQEIQVFRRSYRRPSVTLLQALKERFGLAYTIRMKFSKVRCILQMWSHLECITIPYFFPSLLLRFTQRLCPMGFSALAPLLAKTVIGGCTTEEAVFSVSISGFVWLCFLLVTPWCARMPPSQRRIMVVAGSFISSFGLRFLSNVDSRDGVTLSCAIFGLGLGATTATGGTAIRESLGTWNMAKVDTFLDLASGILILIFGFFMGLILTINDGLQYCFTMMAVIYLVTGIAWMLRPILTSVHCQHNSRSDWTTNGELLLTTG